MDFNKTGSLEVDVALIFKKDVLWHVAVWFGLLPMSEVLDLIASRPSNVELILTGRRAPRAFIEKADIVTEACEIKHYYNKGVQSRTGIEM